MNYRTDLLRNIEALVSEVEKTHRYSMSRIYGLWNEAFGKDEKPQSCASCLLRKVKELKDWMNEEKARQELVPSESEVGEPIAGEDITKQVLEETTPEQPVKKRSRKKKD